MQNEEDARKRPASYEYRYAVVGARGTYIAPLLGGLSKREARRPRMGSRNIPRLGHGALRGYTRAILRYQVFKVLAQYGSQQSFF